MNYYQLKTGLIALFSAMLLSFLFFACSDKQKTEGKTETVNNVLTDAEKEAGWILLFDGKTFNGWHGLGSDSSPPGRWIIDGDVIKKISSDEGPKLPDGQPVQGGDLFSDETYENYEFAFEWKISLAGNSGVKYNVSEEISSSMPPGRAALGWEYQVLDDERHSDNLKPNHRAGCLYDMIPPTDILKPVGEFNSSRIIVDGYHVEHWLNGAKVVEYEWDSPEFDDLFKKSKYRNIPGFKDKRKGHIVLQDHGSAVWFRNIKVRLLSGEK